MINLNDYQYVYKKLIQKLEKNNEYYRLDHTDLIICARALEKTCEAYEQKRCNRRCKARWIGMRAIVCERCGKVMSEGKIYKSIEKRDRTVGSCMSHQVWDIDICPDCDMELTDWLKGGGDEE